jgi:pilus assembly protein CpaF
MFQITINEKGGQQRLLEFDKAEITIGRVQGNDIVLPKGNISKRHSRIVVKDGKFIIIDMQSTNGTYVNGKKITTPQVVKSTDKIYIGDFTLQLTGNGAADAKPAAARGKAAAEEDMEGAGDSGANGMDGGRAAKAGSPGLIDDNFDQEFAGGGDGDGEPAPQAAPMKATSGGASPKKPASRMDDDAGELELDLDKGPGGDEPPDEPSEPEAEPKAPVLPLKTSQPAKKPAPAPSAPAAAPARSQPSRVKPAPANLRGGKPRTDDDEMLAPPAEDRPAAPPAALSTGAGAAPQVAHVAVAAGGPALDRHEAIAHLHKAVVEELHLASCELRAVNAMRDSAVDAARRVAERMRSAGKLAAGEDVDAISREVGALATDFEQLQDLIEDDGVHEIVVTHQREIWIDRDGQLVKADRSFEREADVIALVRRLALLGGLEADHDSPLVDVRLRDASRVVASLPPLAFRGPTVSIRKSSRDAFSLDDLLQNQNLSESMVKLIDTAVRYRKGILVSVGPGVSASATLNAIASILPTDERIVTIERDVELHLGHLNVTSLEPNKELGLAQLVRHAASLSSRTARCSV